MESNSLIEDALRDFSLKELLKTRNSFQTKIDEYSEYMKYYDREIKRRESAGTRPQVAA